MEIGPRDLERKVIEVTLRDTLEQKLISNNEELQNEIESMLRKIHKRMYLKVVEKNIEGQKRILSEEELHNIKKEQINKVMWCGNLDCLKEMEENTNFISFNQQFFTANCLFCGKKAKHTISIIKKFKN